MAVSGYNEETAFVDIFSLDIDSNSHENPLLSSQPTCCSVQSLESYEIRPCVCFLNDDLLIKSFRNAIILYDCKSGQVIKETTLNKQPTCMTTRDDCIYVSFGNLNIDKKVFVFDNRLNKIRTITLRGLIDNDYPIDFTVNEDQIFCTTHFGKGLLFNASGDVEKRYKHAFFNALSVTFNEVTGLVVILWGKRDHDRVVSVYLPSRGDYLATFNVPLYSVKIRINSNINKFFVVTKETGEVYEYDTRDIFTFDDLLTCLSSLIAPEDQSKLNRYFEVQQDNKRWFLRSSDLQDMYEHLRKTGRLSAEELMAACNHAGLSEAVEVIYVYQKMHNPGVIGKRKAMPHGEQQHNEHVETTERERQQLKERHNAAKQEKQELVEELNNSEVQMVTDRLQVTQERLQKTEADNIQLTQSKEEMLKELGGSKKSLKVTKDELAKYQLKFAKESMALEEVLKHTRADMYKSLSPVSAHEESFPEERESLDLSRGSSLAADYGRLMVGIAENLTLDITLRLATLFGLPPAEADMLRRVSFLETPGITLLNFMKTRNIINMYDLTNLQKGLILLQMNRINENLIVPYQSKIDPFHFEENQAPKLLDWPTDDYQASPFAEERPVSSQESEERDTSEQQHDKRVYEKGQMT
ncbi:hypothetical protein BSL78_20305 [Apostichopus japonicus]|uniref:Uncharacterized protein n=1 Tax=Stichopus japonicus TaxID=307972 RepID=A0A2G8K4F5_STIJA|nr:hypothetical protein BSL78_20305 [Apostichopus japonicus]